MLVENQYIVVDGFLLVLLEDYIIELVFVGEDVYCVISFIMIKGFLLLLECDQFICEVVFVFLLEVVVDYKQEGEFCFVVIIFFFFIGIDNYEELDQFVDIVLWQMFIFFGYFKEIDFGDKGGLMIIFFGVLVVFENNVE